MDVDIRGLAFSPASNDIDDQDVYVRSDNELEIDDQIMEWFSNYTEAIVSKKDTKKVTVGHFEEENSDTEEKLSTLKSLNFDTDEQDQVYDTLETETKSLALRLKNDIDERMSDAYLFVLKSNIELDGGREKEVVVILKLNVEEVTRSRIDDSEQELKYEEIENALPETKELQKGATYPIVEVAEFDKDGDLKIYQQDTKSQYFENFFDCITSKSSREQFKAAIKAVESLKQEKTGENLTPSDIQTFNDRVSSSEDGVARDDDIHQAAQDVLGDDYEEDDVERRLFEEEQETIQMDSGYTPETVKIEVDDEIKIEVPIERMGTDDIEIEEPENDMDTYTVTINGSKLEQNYV
jgi:hypothetical protein